MIRDEFPLTLSHCRLHRICRVGACPLLEITITYPCLCPPEGEGIGSAVDRFNTAYRTMAEKLMAWGEGALYEGVLVEFEAAGAEAVYGFDRRLLVCDMSAAFSEQGEGEGEGTTLTVTRILRLSSRRGGAEERGISASDRWRLPSLTLCAPSRRYGKFLSMQKSSKL